MKVKLKQAQNYISIEGEKKLGAKDEIIEVEATFYRLIKDKCEIVSANKKDEPVEKSLDKMNKAELIAKAKEIGLDCTDEEYEAFNKADIIKLINEQSK